MTTSVKIFEKKSTSVQNFENLDLGQNFWKTLELSPKFRLKWK